MFVNRLRRLVKENSLLWGEDVANTYHAAAAQDMETHWSWHIEPTMREHNFNFEHVMDFACGYGRNTDKLLPMSGRITMVDVSAHNVLHCREKYKNCSNVEIVECNGFDLSGVAADSISFLYTFDSMVHFPKEIVKSYIGEFHRVMREGACALIHHSNYTEASPRRDFRLNPHWRNYMSAELFAREARRAGFHVEAQKIISWGASKDIDCISVLKK